MPLLTPTNHSVATETTLGLLKTAADAILVAANALNTKTTAVNTGAVAGTVAVSNFPGTQPVSGTFWQATQPVSFTWAGLTDAQLRASALSVVGSVVADTGLAQPLTNAQLRAADVPVSGTFYPATQAISAAALPLPTGAATESTAASIDGKLPALDGGRLPVILPPGGGGLTDTELRAAPVEVIDPEAANMFLRFFNLFQSPPGYDPALQRLRGTVQVESGTVTTVSTVTSVTGVTTVATVTNQAQIDGVQGRLLAYGADLSAWSDCVRSRIT